MSLYRQHDGTAAGRGSRGTRPQNILQQFSYGSFTTEDIDVFNTQKLPNMVSYTEERSDDRINNEGNKNDVLIIKRDNNVPTSPTITRRSRSIGGLFDMIDKFDSMADNNLSPCGKSPLMTVTKVAMSAAAGCRQDSTVTWQTDKAFHQSMDISNNQSSELSSVDIDCADHQVLATSAMLTNQIATIKPVIAEPSVQCRKLRHSSKATKAEEGRGSKSSDSAMPAGRRRVKTSHFKQSGSCSKDSVESKNNQDSSARVQKILGSPDISGGILLMTPVKISSAELSPSTSPVPSVSHCVIGGVGAGIEGQPMALLLAMPQTAQSHLIDRPKSPLLTGGTGNKSPSHFKNIENFPFDGSKLKKSSSGDARSPDTVQMAGNLTAGSRVNAAKSSTPHNGSNTTSSLPSTSCNVVSSIDEYQKFEALRDIFEKNSFSSPSKVFTEVTEHSSVTAKDVKGTVSDNLIPKIVLESSVSSTTPLSDNLSVITEEPGEQVTASRATRANIGFSKHRQLLGVQKLSGGKGLSRVESLKLSHDLTRKMSRRQKCAMIMESEFDEDDSFSANSSSQQTKISNSSTSAMPCSNGAIDVNAKKETVSVAEKKEHVESRKEGSVVGESLLKHLSKSSRGSGEEGKADSNSDDSDSEFVEKIVVKLNVQRFEEEGDGDDSSDELRVVEMSKVQRISNELLTTERLYIKKLELVDQLFHFQVVVKNRELRMFPDEVIPQIFSNIKSIYQFHHDFLLPQLEQRMANWDDKPIIGDVMKRFAPFLKLYVDYVQNFDRAMNLINFWMDKSTKFARLVEELQKRPECGHLTLQHHMLEPVQRVPRYQLLLKDYLKHLTPDSPDRPDTEKALELVTLAASHANDAMRKIEKFRKLLDINESLGGTVDLISPTRELIKEGRVTRISAKDGTPIERYAFLFNDLLLICHTQPLIIGHKQQYRIKTKLDMDELEVTESRNVDSPDTILIKGQETTIELLLTSPEEKNKWQMAIFGAAEDYKEKKCSRRERLGSIEPTIDQNQLGLRAPTYIKDYETSMCMLCTLPFTTFRRRHHCKACGKVFCARCSSKRLTLAYDPTQRESRVCDQCYDVLKVSEAVEEVGMGEGRGSEEQVGAIRTTSLMHRQDGRGSSMSSSSTSVYGGSELKGTKKAPVILQVKASDPAVIGGYLNLSLDKKTWTRRWFTVHQDFVLYSYKAHQDMVALTSLPLPGYQVSAVEPSDGLVGNESLETTFKVFHAGLKKIYYFNTDDKNTKERWLSTLQKVVLLQLPSETEASLSRSSSVADGGSDRLSTCSSTSFDVAVSPPTSPEPLPATHLSSSSINSSPH